MLEMKLAVLNGAVYGKQSAIRAKPISFLDHLWLGELVMCGGKLVRRSGV